MSICRKLDKRTLEMLESETKQLLQKLKKDNVLKTFSGGTGLAGIPVFCLLYTVSVYNNMFPNSKSIIYSKDDTNRKRFELLTFLLQYIYIFLYYIYNIL
jgi:hypothetical protein